MSRTPSRPWGTLGGREDTRRMMSCRGKGGKGEVRGEREAGRVVRTYEEGFCQRQIENWCTNLGGNGREEERRGEERRGEKGEERRAPRGVEEVRKDPHQCPHQAAPPMMLKRQGSPRGCSGLRVIMPSRVWQLEHVGGRCPEPWRTLNYSLTHRHNCSDAAWGELESTLNNRDDWQIQEASPRVCKVRWTSYSTSSALPCVQEK